MFSNREDKVFQKNKSILEEPDTLSSSGSDGLSLDLGLDVPKTNHTEANYCNVYANHEQSYSSDVNERRIPSRFLASSVPSSFGMESSNRNSLSSGSIPTNRLYPFLCDPESGIASGKSTSNGETTTAALSENHNSTVVPRRSSLDCRKLRTYSQNISFGKNIPSSPEALYDALNENAFTTLQAQTLSDDVAAENKYLFLNRNAQKTNSLPPQSRDRPKFFDYHEKFKPSRIKQYFERKSKYHNASKEEQSENSSSFFQPTFDRTRGRTVTVERNSYQSRSSSSPRLSSPTELNNSAGLRRAEHSSSDLEALKQNLEHRLEPENVKTKMISLWNNIKYGWTFKSKQTMKYDSPLFLLGKCYHRKKDDDESEPEGEFMKDFTSRIWLTYRSNFYPIPGTKMNTDCGWGCMLRSGQMLVAQCLVTHYLGRDWRMYDKQTETQFTFYKEIIRWFSDPIDSGPSDGVPFCLHHLVNYGRHYNKEPGQWFGPASVAYIFRDAFQRASKTIPVLSQLCIYVTQDCTVYLQDIRDLCTDRQRSESSSGSFELYSQAREQMEQAQSSQESSRKPWLRSLILLIPMRLGGEVMNEIYAPCVNNLLSQDNCMGIIGGKPKHSLYFIGWQDDKLIYLDPHFCRDAVDTTGKDFRIESFHCMSPRKLPVSKMDPSCTVGFYIKDEADFDKFLREVQEFIAPPKQRGVYPLFIFNEGSQRDVNTHHLHNGKEKGRVKVTHYTLNEQGQRQRAQTRESEEFIML